MLYVHKEKETHENIIFSTIEMPYSRSYDLIQEATNEEGKKQLKVTPVLGFDYEYISNHKSRLGLFSAMELTSFGIQEDCQDYLEFSLAFITASVFIYEPIVGLSFFAASSHKFEKKHDFPLIKIGPELANSIQGGQSVGIAKSYEFKEINSYFSFCIGA